MMASALIQRLAGRGRAAILGLSLGLGGWWLTEARAGSGLVAPGEFIWGVNGHPLGGDGIYTEQRGVGLAEQMQWLKGLGAGWYRADVFARDPVPGVWEVADELDTIMPAAQAAGIEIYPTLHAPFELRPYGNLLETYTLEQIYQATYQASRMTAEKWAGQIKIWDLMNEPDGWTLSPDKAGIDVSDYYADKLTIAATMLRAQSDGIRAGDPSAKVSLNAGFLHTGFIDAMMGHGVQFDVISWHWYSDMGSVDHAEPFGQYPILDRLLSYGKPIWFGEINTRPYHPGGEAGRAEWLTRQTETLFKYRDRGVEAMFYYELLNLPPTSSDHGYGLVKTQEVVVPGQPVTYEAAGPSPAFVALAAQIADFQNRKTILFEDFHTGNMAGWTATGSGQWNIVSFEQSRIMEHSPGGVGSLTRDLGQTVTDNFLLTVDQGWRFGDGPSQMLGIGLLDSLTGDGYMFSVRAGETTGFKFGIWHLDEGVLTLLATAGIGPDQVGGESLLASLFTWDQATGMLRAYLDGVMVVEVADFSVMRFDRLLLHDAAFYGEAARFDNVWLSTSVPVPEPGGLALLGFAVTFGSLAWLRRGESPVRLPSVKALFSLSPTLRS